MEHKIGDLLYYEEYGLGIIVGIEDPANINNDFTGYFPYRVNWINYQPDASYTYSLKEIEVQKGYLEDFRKQSKI